ncbi:aminopeptidase P family protein [Enterococcus hirae]|nr:aminopeptidase P family protein [Enterococcus hirae]
MTKIEKLQKWLKDQEADWAYISNPEHIAYYANFHSEPHERVLALFIPQAGGTPFLFTPAMETEAAAATGWEGLVQGYLDNEDPWALIAQMIERLGGGNRFAIEKNHLTVDRYAAIKHVLPGDYGTDLTSFIEQQLLIKTPDEIEKLKEAGKWADQALSIGFQAIQTGATEMDVVAEIEYQLKKQGVAAMSFDTLVQTGANAANPHGEPGLRPLEEHKFVLFDLGVIWKGYCSDVSRTVAFKEPNDFDRKIYHLVLEAHMAAFNAVRPGITASELDHIAREVIEDAGYGEYFNHRLGHGIGTTVHEFPSIMEGNDMVLKEGMCFSIEPGIYIPEKVGVRIEDCVCVTKDGALPFTHTPKELTILK